MLDIDIEVEKDKQRIVNATLSISSYAVGEAVLKYNNTNDVGSIPRFSYGDRVTVRNAGTIMMIGTVTNIIKSIEGINKFSTITISDDFWILENTIYLNQDGGITSDSLSSVAVANGGSGGGKTSIARALRYILENGKTTGAISFDYSVSILDEAEMIPFAISTTTYFSLISSIAKWRPNSCAYFDYSVTPHMLRIVDFHLMDTITFNINTDKLTNIQLNPRYDLSPSAIGFILSGVNNWGVRVSAINKVPADASLSVPNSLVVEVDGDATGRAEDPEVKKTKEEDKAKPENEGKMFPRQIDNSAGKNISVVYGDNLPSGGSADGDFWCRHIPDFQQIRTNLIFGDVKEKGIAQLAGADKIKNYDTTATTFEHVDGSFTQRTKLKHCITNIKQKIYYSGVVPFQYREAFPLITSDGRRYAWYSINVRTLNRRKTAFLNDAKNTEVPIEQLVQWQEEEEKEEEEKDKELPPWMTSSPPDSAFGHYYDGLAEDYYNATRHIPYDGELSLVTIPDKKLIGYRANVSGGYAEWAAMLTVINSVKYDFLSDSCSVSLGANTNVSFQEIFARAKEFQNQALKTAELMTEKKPEENDEEEAVAEPPVKNSNNFFRWNNGEKPKNRDRKKRGEEPSYSPSASAVTHSRVIFPPENGFGIGVSIDEDGNVNAVSVRDGNINFTVSGASYKTTLGGDKGYVIVSNRPCKVYLTFTVNTWGKVVKSSISLSKTAGVNIAFDKPRYPAILPAAAEGRYSYLIGEVNSKGEITQEIIGSVSLSYFTLSDYPSGVE